MNNNFPNCTLFKGLSINTIATTVPSITRKTIFSIEFCVEITEILEFKQIMNLFTEAPIIYSFQIFAHQYGKPVQNALIYKDLFIMLLRLLHLLGNEHINRQIQSILILRVWICFENI